MSDQGTLGCPHLPQWVRWLLGAVLLLAFVVIILRVWPVGPDYYYHFRATGEKVLRGETRLFDERGQGFLHGPWVLLLFIPLTWLPVQTGAAVLAIITLLSLVASVHLLRDSKPFPLYYVLLSLANLHTFDHLIRGQVDVFVLLGVALGWWAIWRRRPWLLSLGFLLIGIKPVNTLLVVLLFLFAVRRWPLSRQLIILSLPVLSVVVVGLLIGFDWPLRFLQSARAYYLNDYLSISLWRGASQLGLPAWPVALVAVVALAGFVVLVMRTGLNPWSLGVALATNLVFTPYANGDHYVLLIPAFLFVAREDWKPALLAYLTTWTPLIRLVWGYSAVSIDILYPVVLLGASWCFALRSPQPADHLVAVPG